MGIAGERVQKYLASQGVGSRRAIEKWITEGRITINDKAAQLGDRVTPKSKIKVDGKLVSAKNSGKEENKTKTRVILYNKPEGKICTQSDPKGRPTVFADLPKMYGERWISIGRLDINTRGLLLFTNDGDFANRLMHPKVQFEREYLCRIYGEVNRNITQQLVTGIEVDGEKFYFEKVKRIPGKEGEGVKNRWYSVIIQQGRYKEVRRLWKAVGCEVSRLARIRYGAIALPRGLKLGSWIELDEKQIKWLQSAKNQSNVLTPKVPRKNRRR